MKAIKDPMDNAMKLPNGARFYKCALQINPFEYLLRHNKQNKFKNESEYNSAIVRKCKEIGIEVIAITDHYRIRTAQSLAEEASKAGLQVFPGFEAVTKDGVHFLCLFDPSRDLSAIERVLGDCGIHDQTVESPTGKYDTLELLEEARKWPAICIAAHVTSNGGLLYTLSGRSRINAWTSPNLLAGSIPGPILDAPDNHRSILKNKNSEYRRRRPLALINAQDVSSPEDLDRLGTSCWIKMSKVSYEGLRQAFLDPDSRIRLHSDPLTENHIEFVALTWEGGFLDGAAIHFNENLNVMIGGRGTGKSTIVESLRSVMGLEPRGDEAIKMHEGIVRNVLRNGTKLSLLLRSHKPSAQEYRIERTIPNRSVVKDINGTVLNLTPVDVVPQVEVYGQHEISELARSKEKLTVLLERFQEKDHELERRKFDLRTQLDRSRTRILEFQKELIQIEERLSTLPALEEALRRFQEAGLEERLKEQSLLVREERVLKTVNERIAPFKQLLGEIQEMLPIDRAFLSKKALEELPGKNILLEAEDVLVKLNDELNSIVAKMQTILNNADKSFASVESKWKGRKNSVDQSYEKILRELQKTKVDGEQFLGIRRSIEELRPLRERQVILQRGLKEQEILRKKLLTEWEDVKAEEFRQLERAARRVNNNLANRVRVDVQFAGNREPFFQLIKDNIGGRLSESLELLRQHQSLSLKDFVDTCRQGRESLSKKYGLPPAQCDRLAQASENLLMRLEELDLPPTTKLELNVAQENQPAIWEELDDLSTGQKATAILLLVLLESESPLIIDQPEDDLDNRFITEGIVPKMRDEKRRRQFIFATHNANIPVLGDAELIVGLVASGEADQEGRARIPVDYMGSIDDESVRHLVEEVLEGGQVAFEMRRLKYGF
jgi:hypothetical protein